MIIAYYILNYGKEWLQHSLKYVAGEVDEVHLFYTKTPSHGFQQSIVSNPESREDLIYSMVKAKKYYDHSNIYWHDVGPFQNEGQHRDYAVQYCKNLGATTIVVVDADEIWHPVTLQYAIQQATSNPDIQTFRMPFLHFWRSLDWVCKDPSMPARLINPGGAPGSERYISDTAGRVYHMGYAQSLSLMKYKISIHGHSNEWRPEWWDTKFVPWTPDCGMTDVHPTCKDFWTPEPCGDWTISVLLADHPYMGLRLIE